jgi:OPA family glycerol-3-phosphate transporter-like MFS transporter
LTLSAIPLAIVGLCLAAVVGGYFLNNPLGHTRWFMVRRFINWFPLGMTYAFLYMGRYNLNVAKNALGDLMSKEDLGLIAGTGTLVYGLSFLLNGPLVDKIGGKKGILIAGVGAAFSNAALGVATYLVTARHMAIRIVPVFTLFFVLNMYFQSYGAVSIIKVKAYWFHVRERGVFGAMFGTLISFGVYFAFDWGQTVVDLAQVKPGSHSGWMRDAIQWAFAEKTRSVDATWAVFFVPAIILLFWSALDAWLIKDTPEEAGFEPFDTADASSGKMDVTYTSWELLKGVFTNPLMLLIAAVELTSGVFRNGIAQWYPVFAIEVKQTGAAVFADQWGFLLCVFGICGGFAGGLISDKVFRSRRGPPCVLLCGVVFLLTMAMVLSMASSPWVFGAAAVLVWSSGVGITSLMSGTAATDFGGRKATATSSGIVDGFAYLGSTIQSYGLGYLVTWNWRWWPVFLAPFALLGLAAALKLWNALPPATRKYIAEVELKKNEPLEVA